GEEAVALARLLLQPAEHVEYPGGVDDQRRLPAVEGGGEDGPGAVALGFPPDQLQSGGGRRGKAPWRLRRPPPPRPSGRCAARRAPTPRSRPRCSAAASPGRGYP